MTPKKGPAQGKPDMIGQLSEWLGGIDKGLDQTRNKLGDLKQRVARSKAKPENIKQALRAGFTEDLQELGVKKEDLNQYLEMLDKQFLEKSPELKSIDSFINNLENLTAYQELAANAEVKPKWQAKIESYFGIDGISEYVKPLLDSLGLGFLAGKMKETADKDSKTKTETTAKADTAAKTTGAVAVAATQKEKDKPTAQAKKAASKPKENVEVENINKTTLFFGDSLSTYIGPKDFPGMSKAAQKRAKIGKKGSWGLAELKKMRPEEIKNYKNAVILFGSNDVGMGYSAEQIFENLKKMYMILGSNGVKVFAATVPPFKDYEPYKERYEKLNAERKELNELIRKSPLVYHVVDVAATKEKGGVADNNDPEQLDYKTGDHLHLPPGELEAVYKRELERGSKKGDATEYYANAKVAYEDYKERNLI